VAKSTKLYLVSFDKTYVQADGTRATLREEKVKVCKSTLRLYRLADQRGFLIADSQGFYRLSNLSEQGVL